MLLNTAQGGVAILCTPQGCGGRAGARPPPPHRDGRHGLRLRMGRDQAGLTQTIGSLPVARGQNRGEAKGGESGEQPNPHGHRVPDERSAQETAPEHRRCDRQEPPAHTVTRSRMSSNVTSPIPLTSSRSSMDPNGPFAVRYSMMRWAMTSPTPGRASSSWAVAVLMLIFVVVSPALAELPGTAAVANGCCLCTRICVPSASGAARFSASSAGAPPGAARRLDGVDDPITLVE